jgi:UDP-N-acetylglucosamine 2-epimerase (non-hydrolysing)/GDP/UDP-N,N'-diacetylbacillosamine 2-epimerase (hydrolysing)
MGKINMSLRRISVVTGSRADYGHLFCLLEALRGDNSVKLQLIVTGAHLLASHGSTYKIIEKDGFDIHAKVDVLKFADTEEGLCQSIGLGCQLFPSIWKKLKPDMVVVLGDRFEILPAVITAYIHKIAIAHIHGGETTRGLIDEGIRHSITKMASYHFTSNQVYAKRVIQMGEAPNRVFNLGAPGLDQLNRISYSDRTELSKILKLDLLSGPVAIVTYHPVTLEKQNPQEQIREIFKALQSFPGKIVFTKANVDTYGKIINAELSKFCLSHPHQYQLFDNLGQQRYYSCLKNFDLMIGNSSSGIIEAASFGLPVVNIGDRQKDRVHATNVIDVRCDSKAISAGIKKALTPAFRQLSRKVKNPYQGSGHGQISHKIKDKLKSLALSETIIKKAFFDIKF